MRQVEKESLGMSRMNLMKITPFILGALAWTSVYAATVTVSNTEPRRDRLSGSIVDVHDGCLEFFEGRFFLYGTAYADTDGFVNTNRYVCYSSSDLSSWTYEGELLSNPPAGVYYRPYVKFNPRTRKYVLWYNWYPTLWDGQYGVATSDHPEGPFSVQNGNVKVRNAKPGDHGLFVDEDGTGYVIYTSIALNHGISIEKLTEDFLSSTLEGTGILAEGCEACAMFKRDGKYYVLFDDCCCFCPQGTGARVYSASAPLGPYTLLGNINRKKKDGTPTIPAQQTHVAQIPSKNGMQYLWMGDRWGSRPDGIKGHDFQYWSSPLKFLPDGTIETLRFENEVTIDLPESVKTSKEEMPIRLDQDKPGQLLFKGSSVAELYTTEVEESFKGALKKNYVSNPDGEYPPGFLHASPIPQGWSGTFWTRDGGTFLRELVLWGYYEHARLTAYHMMTFVSRNEEGYYTFPEFFRGWGRGSGHELDGTGAIILGMVLLWQHLPADDPFKDRVYDFLHEDRSPVRYILKRLENEPLIAGSGEFGGGCGIPGLHYNVVQNALCLYALNASASMELEAGDTTTSTTYRDSARRLAANMEKFLVDPEGSWIWCIDPKTQAPDPAIINHEINKGFGGLNGAGCMFADALGLVPSESGWKGAEHSLKTFEKLYAAPLRKEQFDKYGIWPQFDVFRAGLSSGPSYGDGYALQTMLLYDKLDMADKSFKWMAESTYQPIPAYKIHRESPYYFYERSYSPDAEGKVPLEEGCGALNLVNVTEQLKAARLTLGVDDSSNKVVRIVPRLPSSWESIEATHWPVHANGGLVRVHILYKRNGNQYSFELTAGPGQKIPYLSVRMPAGSGFKWYNLRDTGSVELSSRTD
jgi:hypothetical protein